MGWQPDEFKNILLTFGGHKSVAFVESVLFFQIGTYRIVWNCLVMASYDLG